MSVSRGMTDHSGAPRSVAEALGQVVWLLSQSPLHKKLPISALEHSFMPAIINEQFRVFRFGPLPGADDVDQPVGIGKAQIEQVPLGVAIWAHLDEAGEKKLERGEHLSLQDWNAGSRTWLLELVSPFANDKNKLVEVMLADLAQGPFADTPFRLHRTDPATGERKVVTVDQHLRTGAPRH